MTSVSESPQESQEKVLSAAFDRLLETHRSLPAHQEGNRVNTVKLEYGKDARDLILPDGTRVFITHTKGDTRSFPQEPEELFVNVTSGAGLPSLQSKIITFRLRRNGLVAFYINPMSIQIHVGESTINHPINPIDIKESRYSDETRATLRSATPSMVDWTRKVLAEQKYSEPPIRIATNWE